MHLHSDAVGEGDPPSSLPGGFHGKGLRAQPRKRRFHLFRSMRRQKVFSKANSSSRRGRFLQRPVLCKQMVIARIASLPSAAQPLHAKLRRLGRLLFLLYLSLGEDLNSHWEGEGRGNHLLQHLSQPKSCEPTTPTCANRRAAVPGADPGRRHTAASASVLLQARVSAMGIWRTPGSEVPGWVAAGLGLCLPR